MGSRTSDPTCGAIHLRLYKGTRREQLGPKTMPTVTREDTATATIKIRMREPLRANIERAAAQNRRSMNLEMIERLQRSFSEEDKDAFFGGPGLREIAYGMASAFGSHGTAYAAANGNRPDPAEWLPDEA